MVYNNKNIFQRYKHQTINQSNILFYIFVKINMLKFVLLRFQNFYNGITSSIKRVLAYIPYTNEIQKYIYIYKETYNVISSLYFVKFQKNWYPI